MTEKELAQKLNGRQYGEEIDQSEQDEAAKNGLVVVYGYSDDAMEFSGAISGEVYVSDGEEVRVDSKGAFQGWEQVDKDDIDECRAWFKREANGKQKTIKAIFDEDGYTWKYETKIPHHTFDIFEDDEKYCQGIVFNISELKK